MAPHPTAGNVVAVVVALGGLEAASEGGGRVS
jgi:hypothetical protein